MSLNTLYNIAKSRSWGTIGPVSVETGKSFAKLCGVEYALLLFSETAAMETLMRATGIKAGDIVIAAEYSAPVDSMTALAVGAEVMFAANCKSSGAMSIESVVRLIDEYGKKIKLLVYDNIAISSESAEEIYKVCNENNIFVIANLGDNYASKYYADAAVANLGKSCVIDAGRAGAIVTDNFEVYKLAFSYHHCGRPFGESETLNIDTVIGGDFRITEWQAGLVSEFISGAVEITMEREAAALDIMKRFSTELIKPLGIWEGSLGLILQPSAKIAIDAGEEKFAKMNIQPIFKNKNSDNNSESAFIWIKL